MVGHRPTTLVQIVATLWLKKKKKPKGDKNNNDKRKKIATSFSPHQQPA